MIIHASRQQQVFKVGDRVAYSHLGREKNKLNPDRTGTITGYSRLASAVQVTFDDRKSPTILHVTYLQLADANCSHSSAVRKAR